MRVLVRHLPLAQMTVHDRAVVVSVRTTPAPLPCQDDRRAAAAAANNTSSGSFPEPREQPIEHRFRCFGSDRHSRILLLSPTAARWVCRHLHHILLCRLPRLTSASVRAPTSWVVLPANFKPAFARRRLAPLSAPMPLLHGRILLLCSTRGFGAHKTKQIRADGALANGCGAPTTGRAHRTALGHSTRPHISASRHGHERGKRTWRSVKYWHVAIRPEIACGSVNAPGEEPWVFKGVRPCARRAVYEWRSRECCERALEDARPHCPVAPRGAYVPPRPSHCRLTAARRPRSARTRTAPCPAAAPDDLPLAPAHVPAASAHRPAQHPADDASTLEPASRHRRGRVGALRGRHTATT